MKNLVGDMSDSVIEIGVDNVSVNNDGLQTVVRLIKRNFMECITTRLGVDTEFRGQYKSKTPNVGMLVEGFVEGGLNLAEGSLICIGEHGTIDNGTLVADSVLIAGNVKGEIRCRLLELLPTSVVEGQINCQQLEVHGGAKIKAPIVMD